MTSDNVVALLFIMVVTAWGLLCCAFRAYARDAFRQSAFALRDELFDFAASGAVPFSHPSYTRLRCMMNGVIRYSHRVTLGEAILPHVFKRMRGLDQQPVRYRQWLDALDELPAETRDQLLRFEYRFGQLYTKYMLISTPLAWPMFLVLACVEGGFTRARRAVETRARLVEDDALREYEYELEAQPA